MDKLIVIFEIITPFITHPLVLVGAIVIALSMIIIKLLNSIIDNAISTEKKSAHKKVSNKITAINEEVANKISTEEALAENKLLDAKKKIHKSVADNIAHEEKLAHKKISDEIITINKSVANRISIEKISAENKFLEAKKKIHKSIADDIAYEENLAHKRILNKKITINETVKSETLTYQKFTNQYIINKKEYIDNEVATKISTEENLANKKVSDEIIAINEVRDNEILVYQQSANQYIVNRKEYIDNEVATKNSNEEEIYFAKYYKNNWQMFNKILQTYKIQFIYHFTDSSNIRSIKENGGLCSWSKATERKIIISRPGGDILSRKLDKKYNLEDYVRLSFTKKNPMMYSAKKEGRIVHPVILKIDPKVILWKETMFSNMNATKNNHLHGKEIDNFKSIKFETVLKKSHFEVPDIDKPYYQAEVMVKQFIPINFILEGL